jgi:sortase A
MRRATNIFAAVGLLALGYCAVEFAGAWLYQTRETQRFTINLPSHPDTTVERRPRLAIGSTVAILTIPRLGLSTIVVEGAEPRQLKLGPGHIRGTAWPGDGGNVGVAAHRDTYFRPLRLVHSGDTITVRTQAQEYVYQVISLKIVEPNDVEVLRPTGHETLTLVTCYPFDFVGPAPRRFVVRADCVTCVR